VRAPLTREFIFFSVPLSDRRADKGYGSGDENEAKLESGLRIDKAV
jgi:hypothetical protein